MDSVTSSLSSLTTGSVPEHIVEEIDGQPAEWTSVLPLLEAASDEMTIGDLLAGKSFEVQATAALQNLRAVLEAAGASPKQLVSVRAGVPRPRLFESSGD